jgi:CHAD domain-containing protein
MAKEVEIAGLRPDESFADAGRTIIRARFRDMWTHRDGTLSGDEEALHDMRVGSRRLRAALDVFADVFHGAEYRRLHRITARLTDELGGVRDHDVMLLNLQKYRKRVARDERPGIAVVMETLSTEREIARRRLRRFFEYLQRHEYAEHMERLFAEDEPSAAIGDGRSAPGVGRLDRGEPVARKV